MATRQKSPSSSRVQYEEFQPKFEWKEEEDANLLLVHLPGFSREQISTSYLYSNGTIRVIGQMPVGNNKWSRFSQDFPVPKNCIIQKIQGKLKNGVLTLTLPKQTITKLIPQPKTPPPPPAITTPEPRQGQDSSLSGQLKDNKPVSTRKVGDADQKKSNTVSDGKKVVDLQRPANDLPRFKEVGDEKKVEGSGLKMAEDVKGKDYDAETRKKNKEVGDGKKDEEETRKKNGEGNEMEKRKEVVVAGKVKERRGVSGAVKRMKELTMNHSEERQAMVNIGVAVLVIAALGAYIYYTIGSSSESTESN
ncbi:protein RESTRICTED TEV MOVEMENT 2-like [Carica papaya]|uniref:protein RESTRICTED TEV MOVEMENT 2-like n=1 Tax=Carica papaya TaxID=3649 RepID=UPI000B8CCE01|nr:protein RESTRICTED TEV MOVEMENT 2-like [Carica papaya]